jgi:hypothetical protein
MKLKRSCQVMGCVRACAHADVAKIYSADDRGAVRVATLAVETVMVDLCHRHHDAINGLPEGTSERRAAAARGIEVKEKGGST